MSISDLLQLPFETWRTNFVSIRDYYFHYYSVFMLPPILYFFYATLRKLDPKNIAIALGFLGGSGAVLLLLKGFNEYIYNTSTIVFLMPLLAAAFYSALKAWFGGRNGEGPRKASRVAGALVLVSFAGLFIHWAYQGVLMSVSAADYIRRSTPWAMSGYLENWSGGFGVAEAIAYVERQEPPVLVLADPQWGNPRTSLEVYNFMSEEVLVLSLTSDFLSEAGTQSAKKLIAAQPFKNRLIVFSMARNEDRAQWQDSVLKYACDSREEIQVEPTQPPIVVCRF
jgi:hypothetical protein